nr:unnamed protein product [Digitaria exilis]
MLGKPHHTAEPPEITHKPAKLATKEIQWVCGCPLQQLTCCHKLCELGGRATETRKTAKLLPGLTSHRRGVPVVFPCVGGPPSKRPPPQSPSCPCCCSRSCVLWRRRDSAQRPRPLHRWLGQPATSPSPPCCCPRTSTAKLPMDASLATLVLEQPRNQPIRAANHVAKQTRSRRTGPKLDCDIKTGWRIPSSAVRSI